MKFNPLRSKKIKLPKSSKIKTPGERMHSDKNESAERVNRTVYLTVAVLLIVLAVAVAMTSAANRAKKGQPSEITDAETTAKTPETAASLPENTTPAPAETIPPAETARPSGNDTDVSVGAKIPLFSLPAEGTLGKEHDPTVQVFSNTLGEWRVHLGIDIMTNVSAPVYAAASGKISQISDDPLWGKCVWIEHDGDAVSVYRGLSDELADGIEVGAKVDEGRLLGAVGEGGILELADEPHLHFEMKVGGQDVDPIEYFSKSALEALSRAAETVPQE